ncbi:phage holin family protein [Flavobacterium sediminilitoris]|uniref:Phage holin family protein n=1 Tax=Flavobacterium sediminilitoris TaxID=2024526 RepID=A0ABY4HJF1_9FLAO|nr:MULTISPECIES: phage holin family protein [Flavobacterium]UOX32630.1 phage holin family protein [Flavobacterium sediminilitoris]
MKTKIEDKATAIENLFEKAENYTKTSVELIKLSAIEKISEAISVLVSHIAIIVLVAFFLFFINIGISLWIGKLIGEYYIGFLIVSFVYLLLGLLIYKYKKKTIENPINELMINTLLKNKIEENEKER